MNIDKIAWIDEEELADSNNLIAISWYQKYRVASALDEYKPDSQNLPVPSQPLSPEKKRLYKKPSEVNLPEAYNKFKDSYEKATGKSWDESKFMNRAAGWLFYGDEAGYITVRPQRSGLYKLVGMAGNPKSIIKAFDYLMSENKPTWGMVSGGIKNMAEKKGMRTPPGWLIKLIMSKGISSAILGGAEIVGVESDGKVTLKYKDIGLVDKYFIGNDQYYSWLQSSMGDFIKDKTKQFFGFGKQPQIGEIK